MTLQSIGSTEADAQGEESSVDYGQRILDAARRWAFGTNVEVDDRVNPAEKRTIDLANLRQLAATLTLDGGGKEVPGDKELVCAVRRLEPGRKKAVHAAVHALVVAFEKELAQDA